MDRKPLLLYKKPSSYGTSGPSTSTEEILLFVEAIIEVDKFTDYNTTPVILFYTLTKTGGIADFYTYKKLNHQFHDRYRCHMHLIGVNPDAPGLDARSLEEQISWQALSREVESAKLGEKVAVEVKRLVVIWKGEESRVRKYPSDCPTEQLCSTNLSGMDNNQLRRVFKKMELRGWIDRMAIVYGIK